MVKNHLPPKNIISEHILNPVHWADVAAKKLNEISKKHVLATAITPSGPIHIGNMREVLTTDAVYRSLISLEGDGQLIYIGDTYDPLRKRYPFLPSHYEEHIGKPLSEIPCPCGSHDNYAQHYLQPFLRCLEDLGIYPTVHLAHELYTTGKYQEAIQTALQHADKIQLLIERITKRKLPENWVPLNIKCATCGRLDTTLMDYTHPTVSYKCPSGHEGTVDTRKNGTCKLPWRIDWPARWKIFGVTFEAFGKDHAAAGGSWDTGKILAEKIFHYPPPMPLVYEFINLKGKGAMHGSTGTAISAQEMLQMTPPEVLRFLLMKQNPLKHIEFDTGFGLLNLVDEYDVYEEVYYGKKDPATGMKDINRTYELSQPGEIAPQIPFHIPYRHLVTLAQIGENWDNVKTILLRTGQIPSALSQVDESHLKKRLDHVQYWLNNFAPEIIRFEVLNNLPPLNLSPYQKKFLCLLANIFKQIEWKPDLIHNAIYEIISEEIKLGNKQAGSDVFKTIYQVLLGSAKGPRAGYFLSTLEKDFVIQRFYEAAN